TQRHSRPLLHCWRTPQHPKQSDALDSTSSASGVAYGYAGDGSNRAGQPRHCSIFVYVGVNPKYELIQEITMSFSFRAVTALAAFAVCASLAYAQNPQDCSKVPDYNKLKTALSSAVKEGKGANGGLGNQEWGTVVNRDGIVCAVVFTGPNRGAEWPGSRLISAEKANTANAFSTDNFALSTGNIFSAAQPGNSLYSIVSGPDPNT